MGALSRRLYVADKMSENTSVRAKKLCDKCGAPNQSASKKCVACGEVIVRKKQAKSPKPDSKSVASPAPAGGAPRVAPKKACPKCQALNAVAAAACSGCAFVWRERKRVYVPSGRPRGRPKAAIAKLTSKATGSSGPSRPKKKVDATAEE